MNLTLIIQFVSLSKVFNERVGGLGADRDNNLLSRVCHKNKLPMIFGYFCDKNYGVGVNRNITERL
jgi:hypothetical protein